MVGPMNSGWILVLLASLYKSISNFLLLSRQRQITSMAVDKKQLLVQIRIGRHW
jgi:hypothetical protein